MGNLQRVPRVPRGSAACMHACMHARARGPYSNTTFRSLGLAEVAADFSFSHRSSDQDYPEIAPNDADGLVTSCRYGRTLYTIRGIENWVLFAI